MKEVHAVALVGDENPVRVGLNWRGHVAENMQVPFSRRCRRGRPVSLFPKRNSPRGPSGPRSTGSGIDT